MQKRIIKFRHFSEDLGKLVDVHYIDFLRNGFGVQTGQNSESVRWEFPDELQLQQFTGLYDMDGRDIYEGDVLQYWIEYTEQSDLYTVTDANDLHIEFNHSDPYYRFTSVKIVANIHENSEL